MRRLSSKTEVTLPVVSNLTDYWWWCADRARQPLSRQRGARFFRWRSEDVGASDVLHYGSESGPFADKKTGFEAGEGSDRDEAQLNRVSLLNTERSGLEIEREADFGESLESKA